jgi:hypothetical protein
LDDGDNQYSFLLPQSWTRLSYTTKFKPPYIHEALFDIYSSYGIHLQKPPNSFTKVPPNHFIMLSEIVTASCFRQFTDFYWDHSQMLNPIIFWHCLFQIIETSNTIDSNSIIFYLLSPDTLEYFTWNHFQTLAKPIASYPDLVNLGHSCQYYAMRSPYSVPNLYPKFLDLVFRFLLVFSKFKHIVKIWKYYDKKVKNKLLTLFYIWFISENNRRKEYEKSEIEKTKLGSTAPQKISEAQQPS